MMKQYTLICLLLAFGLTSNAQIVAFNSANSALNSGLKQGKQKTKAASYSSLGYAHALNYNDIIVGGTTTSYRKFGFFINYKVGIQNFMMPTQGEKGEYSFANVQRNNWTTTGRTEEALAFMMGGGLTVAVTKRWPVYFGAGISRSRQFFEYLDPNDNNSPKWNLNENSGKFVLNYTAGTFIPLFNRVVLNIGYDHYPQCVFVGLCISSQTNFEDADEWWWGGD